ncbi:MAG TPA: hypothetical protein VNW29_04275 [Candidatus Sulfotelmatobacter sp.]|jgi:IS30 family transposase|nr:hypothetical protein [Candidatus Sulfotelmatobacter sp.]
MTKKITFEHRKKIEELNLQKMNIKDIAVIVDLGETTVSDEIQFNGGRDNYSASFAEKNRGKRIRTRKRETKLKAATIDEIIIHQNKMMKKLNDIYTKLETIQGRQ